MGKTKKHTRFVIFVQPQSSDEPDRYVEQDGTTTYSGSRAARFWTRDEAKTFAQKQGIELNQRRYIGPEGFAEFELQPLTANR
jgi:hypothetical protein